MAVLGVARVNSGRLNAFRLGHYQPWVKVFINGVDRTGGLTVNDARTVITGTQITQLLNHEPDTASVRVLGFVPVKGQEIKIYLGSQALEHQLFGGLILNVTASAFGTNVFYDLDCIDYTWLLNRRKVTKRYTGQSATAIITDLISTFSSGFTITHLASGLATIDEITFTNEDLTDALTRVMERIGGYWYCDYARDIHAFVTPTDTAEPVTDAIPRGARNIRHAVDLSQIVTRVNARGSGTQVLSECAVGQTSIPVESAEGSGTVESGPQRITYSGVVGTDGAGSNTGYIVPPPAQPLLGANLGGAGHFVPGNTHLMAMSYVTEEGETTIGPTSSYTIGVGENAIQVFPMTIPTDPKITEKNLWIGSAGGDASTLRLQPGSPYPASTTTGGASDYNAAWATVPTSNTAGFGSQAAEIGDTSLLVEELSVFPSAGWVEAPGGQIIRYTGRSGSSGSGTLTGIPASGIGSITAPIRSGTLRAVPTLTGIPSSGAGSILYAIKRGDEALIFTQRNDASAQTNLASLIGGDGVQEYFFTDGRLGIDELTARADALLTERNTAIVTVNLETRDPSVSVGKTLALSVSYPPVSGTFNIQRVNITELAFDGRISRVFPRRVVELTSKRFSFEDIVRQIQLVGRPN